jgi:hypothetical protein
MTTAHTAASMAALPATTVRAYATLVREVAVYRAQADALEAGTSDLTAIIPAEAHAATIAGMRAKADIMEANAVLADAVLDKGDAARARSIAGRYIA